jgi:hypothetical protein
LLLISKKPHCCWSRKSRIAVGLGSRIAVGLGSHTAAGLGSKPYCCWLLVSERHGNMGTWERGGLQGNGWDQGSGTQARMTPEPALFGPEPLWAPRPLFVCCVYPRSTKSILGSAG